MGLRETLIISALATVYIATVRAIPMSEILDKCPHLGTTNPTTNRIICDIDNWLTEKEKEEIFLNMNPFYTKLPCRCNQRSDCDAGRYRAYMVIAKNFGKVKRQDLEDLMTGINLRAGRGPDSCKNGILTLWNTDNDTVSVFQGEGDQTVSTLLLEKHYNQIEKETKTNRMHLWLEQYQSFLGSSRDGSGGTDWYLLIVIICVLLAILILAVMIGICCCTCKGNKKTVKSDSFKFQRMQNGNANGVYGNAKLVQGAFPRFSAPPPPRPFIIGGPRHPGMPMITAPGHMAPPPFRAPPPPIFARPPPPRYGSGPLLQLPQPQMLALPPPPPVHGYGTLSLPGHGRPSSMMDIQHLSPAMRPASMMEPSPPSLISGSHLRVPQEVTEVESQSMSVDITELNDDYEFVESQSQLETKQILSQDKSSGKRTQKNDGKKGDQDSQRRDGKVDKLKSGYDYGIDGDYENIENSEKTIPEATAAVGKDAKQKLTKAEKKALKLTEKEEKLAREKFKGLVEAADQQLRSGTSEWKSTGGPSENADGTRDAKLY